MLYCIVCSFVPEYCMIKKDFTECKAWLQAQHPLLFEELYGPAPEEKKGEVNKEGEDKKEEDSKQKKP
jgi:hypothetical protein